MGNCINCNNFHITREELNLGIIDIMKIKTLVKINLDREYTLLDENGFKFVTNVLKKDQIVTCSEDLILTLESTASSIYPPYNLYEIIDNEQYEKETSIIDDSSIDLDDDD